MYSVQKCSLPGNPGGRRIEVDADSTDVNSMEIVLMPARKALVAFCRKCCFDAGVPHDALSVECAWASTPPNFTSLCAFVIPKKTEQDEHTYGKSF